MTTVESPNSAEVINARKADHINFCLDHPSIDRQGSQYAAIRLMPNALPELNFSDIDTSLYFLGKKISMPLMISSMTGGNSALVKRVNKNLALAAEACQIPMAVGSQRVMTVDSSARDSFDLRQYAPSTVLIANIGAVQLNCGLGKSDCNEVIDILKADGLYLHLNALQEVIQTEGDTDFSGLLSKIESLKNEIKVPLLIKEVGCGFSPNNVESLKKIGITHIDLSGNGGTSWSKVEALRSKDNGDLGLIYQDWGLSTVEMLKQNAKFRSELKFIASGGIRSGLDLAKSIILGARLGGVALPFLKAATESTEAVVDVINKFHKELKTAMFLMGIQHINELFLNESLIINGEETWSR